MSTGPRTLEGLERIRQANLRHGRYTKAAKDERRNYRVLKQQSHGLLKQIRADLRNAQLRPIIDSPRDILESKNSLRMRDGKPRP